MKVAEEPQGTESTVAVTLWAATLCHCRPKDSYLKELPYPITSHVLDPNTTTGHSRVNRVTSPAFQSSSHRHPTSKSRFSGLAPLTPQTSQPFQTIYLWKSYTPHFSKDPQGLVHGHSLTILNLFSRLYEATPQAGGHWYDPNLCHSSSLGPTLRSNPSAFPVASAPCECSSDR